MKLSAFQKNGFKSEIQTTLDVDALKSLGWGNGALGRGGIGAKKCRQSLHFLGQKTKPSDKSSFAPTLHLSKETTALPTSFAPTPSFAFMDYNRKWYYANLRELVRKGALVKHGLDTDLMKLYICRRFGVIGLTQLDEKQWAIIAAEVNAMKDAEICAKRCARIKAFLKSS